MSRRPHREPDAVGVGLAVIIFVLVVLAFMAFGVLMGMSV